MTVRAAFLLLVATILACTMKPGAPPKARSSAGPRLVVVPIFTKRPDTPLPVAFVEIATTEDARHRGLGGRGRLAPDSGMLFVYGASDYHRYWMKDCLIGLDIAFIDADRRILNVATLPAAPGVPDARIPAVDSRGPCPFVLETAAGWLDAHGLGVGDEVDLSAALVGVVPR